MLRAIRRPRRAAAHRPRPHLPRARTRCRPSTASRRGAYVDLLVEEMIPAVAEAGLARFCDVFMEPGVFDRAESERILRAGLEHGLRPEAPRRRAGGERGRGAGRRARRRLRRPPRRRLRAPASARSPAPAPWRPSCRPPSSSSAARRYAPARRAPRRGRHRGPGHRLQPRLLPHAQPAARDDRRLLPDGRCRPPRRSAPPPPAAPRALRLPARARHPPPGAPADLVLWDARRARRPPLPLRRPAAAAGVWKRGQRVA